MIVLNSAVCLVSAAGHTSGSWSTHIALGYYLQQVTSVHKLYSRIWALQASYMKKIFNFFGAFPCWTSAISNSRWRMASCSRWIAFCSWIQQTCRMFSFFSSWLSRLSIRAFLAFEFSAYAIEIEKRFSRAEYGGSVLLFGSESVVEAFSAKAASAHACGLSFFLTRGPFGSWGLVGQPFVCSLLVGAA
jgi:hypothetical protein